MYRLLVLITVLLASRIKADLSSERNVEDGRDKRQVNSLPLVYPYGGTYKLIMGFSSPVKSEDYVNLAFTVNFQYQYLQFQNISQLSKYYVIKEISREEREAELLTRRDERLLFYRAVADMMQMRGINSEHCIQRAICEAAQHPLDEDGVFGELFHILLTPDYGKTPFDEDDNWREEMSSYIDAATAGRQMFDCGYIYNNCPQGQGILDLVSLLRDD